MKSTILLLSTISCNSSDVQLNPVMYVPPSVGVYELLEIASLPRREDRILYRLGPLLALLSCISSLMHERYHL